MRTIQEPVHVKTERNTPYLLRWRGTIYEVRRVLNFWVLEGEWWVENQRRVYYCVSASSAHHPHDVMMTLYCQTLGDETTWHLASLFD